MKHTFVISAFPACGKSYCFNNYNGKDLKILDSDSSKFSWVKDKNGNDTAERNPDFPSNYIEHIKENIGKVDIIFVSSHKSVRDALKDNNINYILVYPSLCKDVKAEYISRYKQRGNNENFINMINKNWDSFINEIDNEVFPIKLRLWEGEFIKDIFTKKYCPIYKEFCSVKQSNADEYEDNPCCRCRRMKKLIDITI